MVDGTTVFAGLTVELDGFSLLVADCSVVVKTVEGDVNEFDCLAAEVDIGILDQTLSSLFLVVPYSSRPVRLVAT